MGVEMRGLMPAGADRARVAQRRRAPSWRPAGAASFAHGCWTIQLHGAFCGLPHAHIEAVRAALPAAESVKASESEAVIGALHLALTATRGAGAALIGSSAEAAHAAWLANAYETLAVHACDGVWIEKFCGRARRPAASLVLRQGDVAAFIDDTVLITDPDGMRLYKPWPSSELPASPPDNGGARAS